MIIQKEITTQDPYWHDSFGSEQKEWIEAWRDSCVTDGLEIDLCSKGSKREDGTLPFNVAFDEDQIKWVIESVNGKDNEYANVPKKFIKHCCMTFYKDFMEREMRKSKEDRFKY